ncbi:MAG: Slp family lipoprotein [Alteromonadaceae bacterium]|nr:Slp family lipoprotein [Alteromonadaceae bacterium]
MKNFMLYMFITLFISGCTIIPDKLQLDDNSTLVTFSDVRAQPDVQVGLNARWGGVIAKVDNQKERTMVEIVRFPLKSTMRPIVGTETEGRFRIYYKGLLDPVLYKEGKAITVVGTIAKSEQGIIGKQDYLYPVLETKNVYLWKDKTKNTNNNNNFLYDPFWSSPYYWNYYPSYSHGYLGYGAVAINHSNGGQSSSQSGQKK